MVTSQWHLANNNNSLFFPHYRKSITQNANKEVVAIKLLNPRKGGNGDGEAARCESGISAEWVFLCFLWELRTKSTPEQSQRDRPSHPVYLSYPILKMTQGNLKTLKHKPNTELPGGGKYTNQGDNYSCTRRNREKDSSVIISEDWRKDWTQPVILYMATNH